MASVHGDAGRGVETEVCAARVRLASRARFATATLFLADGMTFGTWAALIPSFQEKLALSTGQLSWVLGGLVVGAMLMMPLAGRLIAAYGSQRVASIACFAFPVALVYLAWAPSLMFLVLAAFLFGLSKGAIDMAINAQGITVEMAVGRPIYSSFQAYWSVGGLSAAFLISQALHWGLAVDTLPILMAGLLVIMVYSSLGKLIADPPRPKSDTPTPSRLSLPSAGLLRLAALCFLAFFTEGIMNDWSAVYAHRITQVSMATAPVAYAVFAVCMAVGRFLGDSVNARLGAARMLRLSGGLLVLGMAIAVFVGTWPVTLIGFGAIGLGVANLVPIIFGAAARAHVDGAGPGLATVTTLGYVGFLAEPLVIGGLASWLGLPIAFGLMIVGGLTIATWGVAIILRPAAQLQPQIADSRAAGDDLAA